MHALKLIGALLGVACVGLAVVMARAPSLARPPSNTLVVGLDAEPRSLDPHTTTASSDFRVLVNVYEGLVRFASGSLTPEPALADSWQVSKDGKHYTFSLKSGVRFQDGTPFDAEAVKFNFDRMLDEQHPYHDTGPFPLAFFFEKIARSVVLDSHTLRFELVEPFAPLLANLCYPSGFIVSPAAIRRKGSGVGRSAVGTGPFRFASWDAGQRLLLERNSDYHGTPAASERVVFRPIADPMTRVAELRAGHVDIVPELSPDNIGWFRRAPKFTVLEASGPHLWFLILNLKKPALRDVRVRRALNLAVDKRALVKTVLQNTASVAAGPIAAAFGGAAGDLEPYAYDPARARALLREAGVAPGHALTLAAPESGSGMLAPMQMATVIQANLNAVGFAVSIESYEWNSYLSKVNAGLDTLDMAAMAWMTNDPDTLPYLALRSEAHPPAGFNSGWYENREVDELLGRARRETSADAREELYAQVQRLVHADAPWLFVASWKQNVVARDDVQGLLLEPSFLLKLSGVGKR